MRKLLTQLGFLFCFLSASAQHIQSYSFSSLQEKLKQESQDQFVLVNFWATWCRPCIQELPYFESLTEEYAKQNLKVLLVSLDMEKEKAAAYAQKKDLKSEVLYLDEVDFNRWIDQISPDWSGAIPATLMLAPSGQTSFYEGEFTKEELYDSVKRFMQNND